MDFGVFVEQMRRGASQADAFSVSISTLDGSLLGW